MIDFSLPTILKYLGAFAVGFVGTLIPSLIGGAWPIPQTYIAALGYGLVATGLFHAIPPRAVAPMALSQQPVVNAASLPDLAQVVEVPKASASAPPSG